MANYKTNLLGEKISKNPLLRDVWITPPFSVLNAREGNWQRRKKQWIRLGIQSEIGRGELSLAFDGGHDKLASYRKKAKNKEVLPGGGGGNHTKTCYLRSDGKSGVGSINAPRSKSYTGGLDGDKYVYDYMPPPKTGTSIFDPVLCELMYKWFCPIGGKIFDPFAGGSVRGIVANYLGYRYTGIDLSGNQIKANRTQAKEIIKGKKPKWTIGDSTDCLSLAKGKYDFIFSCPPYGDLEIYSDDAKDLSTLSYFDFVKSYTKIIKRSVKMLKQNRFACFVVANIRDKKTGFYNLLVSDTIKAFQKAGALYYNEGILITAIGSLPIRIGKQFKSGRKLGKTHQNILIFYKGDPKKIKENFKEVIKVKL